MLRIFVEEGNAYALLAKAAREVWGMEALPELIRLSGGKPIFQGLPNCRFSLSHSGGLAMCALSDGEIGADVERIRPRRPELPSYVFRGADYQRYLSLGGDWPAFYTLWTELESIVKYTGQGLSALRRAVIPPDCTVIRLSGPGWQGAVCVQESALLTQKGPIFYAKT